MRWPAVWNWTSTRTRTLALVAAGSILGVLVLRGVQGSLSSVLIDRARLLIPTTPLVPAAEAVLAKEYGQVGHVYVREGEAVIAGQPLFSLERDPQINQDLAERGISRDLTDVNEQIRDAKRSIDGLSERIVLSWEFANPYLDQQIEVARRRLMRLQELWQNGGITRDLVDDAQERMLRLREAQLMRQQNNARVKDLIQLRQDQQAQLRVLAERQRWLHRQDLLQRAAGRIHPPGSLNQDGSSDYAMYRAPARAWCSGCSNDQGNRLDRVRVWPCCNGINRRRMWKHCFR